MDGNDSAKLEEDSLEGYRASARSFCFSAEQLRLVRHWGSKLGEDDRRRWTAGESVEERIHGKGTLGNDAITVIGGSAEPVKDFELTIWRSNQEKREEYWKRLSEDRILDAASKRDSSPETHREKLLSMTNTWLDASPPTFSIGFIPDDWHNRTQDSWVADCLIPARVFDALAADLRSGLVHSEMSVTVRLTPALTNASYAEWSVPVTFGIIPDSHSRSGFVHGWIESVGWHGSALAVDGSKKVTVKDSREDPRLSDRQQREIAADLNRLTADLHQLTASADQLVRVVTMALVVLVVLLGTMILFG